MEDAGLALVRRQGRESIWELQKEPLAAAQGFLEQISTEWDAALERLRHFVENERN
jgi:hypothetical protein